EDVVDEEENVASLDVAEVLRHGERGQRHAGTRTGRLVHLAVDENRLALLGIVEPDDPALDHLVVQVVALAGTLTDAAEDREAAALHGHVANELEQGNGLAHAGAAEETDLSTAGIGAEQVDD